MMSPSTISRFSIASQTTVGAVASITVTVMVQVLELPQASTAVQVTSVVPTG